MSDVVYLAHHGIKGQKWGVRRYQNSDGSYTDEGRRRRGLSDRYNASLSDNTKKKLKTAGKVALGVGAAAAVGYGAYKLSGTKALRSVSKSLNKSAPRYKYSSLSDEELVARIGRIENEMKLDALSRSARRSEGQRHLEESGLKGLDKAVTAITAGTTFAVVKSYLEREFDLSVPRLDKK